MGKMQDERKNNRNNGLYFTTSALFSLQGVANCDARKLACLGSDLKTRYRDRRAPRALNDLLIDTRAEISVRNSRKIRVAERETTVRRAKVKYRSMCRRKMYDI